MNSNLTEEEAFLWHCAAGWRTPNTIRIPEGLDWVRIAEIGVANRMAWLLKGVLTANDAWESIPEAPQREIQESADRLASNADMLGSALQEYLERADAAGMETVILKGLSICENVYGEKAMRPGGDIDILVRRDQVADSIAVLSGMEIGAFWPNLMADAYYERHHLHQQRSTEDLKIWFEIHWALDHPYTLFTIDYDALMDRAAPGTLLGSPVHDLTPHDLLLTLAVHLVKHAVYLPVAHGRPDLARAILADGMLMYYLDIAEAIRVYQSALDWDALARLAAESGAGDVIGSVLRTCRDLLDAGIPQAVLDRIPVGKQGAVTSWAMNRVVDREIAQHLGEPPSRFWDAMLITNGAFILRPIRLLESAAYFLPPRDYLSRRYGSSGPAVRLRHFVRAAGQFTAFAWDSVYFAVERHLRLKRMGYSTSLFNRLETEG